MITPLHVDDRSFSIVEPRLQDGSLPAWRLPYRTYRRALRQFFYALAQYETKPVLMANGAIPSAVVEAKKVVFYDLVLGDVEIIRCYADDYSTKQLGGYRPSPGAVFDVGDGPLLDCFGCTSGDRLVVAPDWIEDFVAWLRGVLPHTSACPTAQSRAEALSAARPGDPLDRDFPITVNSGSFAAYALARGYVGFDIGTYGVCILPGSFKAHISALYNHGLQSHSWRDLVKLHQPWQEIPAEVAAQAGQKNPDWIGAEGDMAAVDAAVQRLVRLNVEMRQRDRDLRQDADLDVLTVASTRPLLTALGRVLNDLGSADGVRMLDAAKRMPAPGRHHIQPRPGWSAAAVELASGHRDFSTGAAIERLLAEVDELRKAFRGGYLRDAIDTCGMIAWTRTAHLLMAVGWGLGAEAIDEMARTAEP